MRYEYAQNGPNLAIRRLSNVQGRVALDSGLLDAFSGIMPGDVGAVLAFVRRYGHLGPLDGALLPNRHFVTFVDPPAVQEEPLRACWWLHAHTIRLIARLADLLSYGGKRDMQLFLQEGFGPEYTRVFQSLFGPLDPARTYAVGWPGFPAELLPLDSDPRQGLADLLFATLAASPIQTELRTWPGNPPFQYLVLHRAIDAIYYQLANRIFEGLATCAGCGATYLRRHGNQKFCSPDCSARTRAARYYRKKRGRL